jgi:hypothetical protein
MKRPLEFVLGLIGGMVGFTVGFFVMWARSSLGVGTEGNINNLLISAIVFSVFGIVGACLVVNSSHTKVAGWLMIIAAVGISAVAGVMGALIFFMSGILLIIAGLLAAFKDTRV